MAVILVVAFHAGLPVSGGFVGVDMFFVISGFVITSMLWRQVTQPGRFSFVTFYARRVRRLLPALALLLVVVAVGSAVFLSPLGPQEATARTGTAASLFSANLQLARAGGDGYFGLTAETNALLHTWSLSVEEQFYFVFPAFLVVVARVARGRLRRFAARRVAFAAVAVACIASFGVSYLASGSRTGTLDSTFAFYSPFTRAWEFGAGVLLALALPRLRRLPEMAAVGLGLVGVVMVAVAAFRFDGSTPFPGTAALLPVVGTVLLIAGGAHSGRGVYRALSLRPAVWIGDVSYGWYLWHWPLFVFAAATWPHDDGVLVIVAVASLVPTALSYRFVENPIRFDDRLVGRPLVMMVAGCILVPILAFIGLSSVTEKERDTDAVRRIERSLDENSAQLRGCEAPAAVAWSGLDACTWRIDAPRGTVVLIGDSNAGQFADAVIEAGNDAGYDVAVVARLGCPFVRATVTPECDRFVDAAVDDIVGAAPSLVIMASSASQYVDRGELVDLEAGRAPTSDEGIAQLWGDGVTSVLAPLDEHGIASVVVQSVPHPGGNVNDWLPQTCSAIRIFTDSCLTDALSRDGVETQQHLARDATSAAVAHFPSTVAVDFTGDLCSEQECPTHRDGLLLYRDGTHLSTDGAMTFTDRFAELIDRFVRPASPT